MTIKIFMVSINCDNAAYEGEGCEEAVAANLARISHDILTGSQGGHVWDYNGNIVGKYFFAEA